MNARCATIFTTVVVAVLLLSTVGGVTPHYIWNASNSVPVGLYRLQPATTLTVAELVAVQPPDLLAAFLDLNGYLPIGVPMLKRVLALPGQTIWARHKNATREAVGFRLGTDAASLLMATSLS